MNNYFPTYESNEHGTSVPVNKYPDTEVLRRTFRHMLHFLPDERREILFANLEDDIPMRKGTLYYDGAVCLLGLVLRLDEQPAFDNANEFPHDDAGQYVNGLDQYKIHFVWDSIFLPLDEAKQLLIEEMNTYRTIFPASP